MKIKVLEWINEDELTDDIMYNALYSLSWIKDNVSRNDKAITVGVRMFPKEIEVIDDEGE